MENRTFRCSSLYKLTRLDSASTLTEKQSEKLKELEQKETFTVAQQKEFDKLKAKRDAKPKLSTGAITELKKLFYAEKFDFQKNHQNKYTEKGINQESEGISEIVKFLGLPMVVKNEKRYFNDFINGEPDTVLKPLNFQMDLKCVYYPDGLDAFEEVDKEYEWQQHGYNWLTGVENSVVAKILLNPKGDTLEKEVFAMAKQAKVYPITESFRNECIDYLNFERHPIEDRVKLYVIKTEQHHIETIKQAVELCRVEWDKLENAWNNKNKIEIELIKNF